MDFGGESQTIQVGSDNSYNGGLNVSLPVFAPTLYKSINLTKTDVELAVEKARSSKLDLVNQVTKAYYQLLLAQDSYKVLLQSYAQAEANYEVVKAKYEQGTVSSGALSAKLSAARSMRPFLYIRRSTVLRRLMQAFGCAGE